MKLKFFIASWLMVAPTTSIATQVTPEGMNGEVLLSSCRANEQRCGSYLQGVLDMMIAIRHDECGAPRYDTERLRAAYVEWAERNNYFESVHMIAGAENALKGLCCKL